MKPIDKIHHKEGVIKTTDLAEEYPLSSTQLKNKYRTNVNQWLSSTDVNRNRIEKSLRRIESKVKRYLVAGRITEGEYNLILSCKPKELITENLIVPKDPNGLVMLKWACFDVSGKIVPATMASTQKESEKLLSNTLREPFEELFVEGYRSHKIEITWKV